MKITALENIFRKWFTDKKEMIFLLALTAMSIYVRYKARDITSGDYTRTLLPWFELIKKEGFSALKTQIGDYPIPYQVLIFLLTRLPGNPMYLYKCTFFLTDIMLGFAAALLAEHITGRRQTFFFTAAIILVLPEVVLNSSYWSQCDSLWSGLTLFALLFLMKRNYFLSFVFLGAAFSFKIQTVFIFPLFVMYYFREGGFSILNALIIPTVFLLLSCPAFIAGRPVTSLFSAYFFQVYEYRKMVTSFPSFWALTQLLEFKAYYRFAVMVTFSILGIFFYVILNKKIDMKNEKTLLILAAICTWTCVLFLPSMHERYSYLTDILLILLMIADRDYLPFAIVPPIVSIVSYGWYLTQGEQNLIVMAAAHMICYLGVIILARIKYLRNPGVFISESAE